MFQSQEFTWNPHLTNFVQGWDMTYPGSVALRAFTPVPVELQSAAYKVLRRGDWLRDEMKVRPLGGEPELAQWGTTEATYACQEYALAVRIDDRTRFNTKWLNAGTLTIDEMNASFLGWKAMIRRDRFWSTNFFKSGVWTTNWSGVASAPNGTTTFLQWDQSGSDILGFVDDARDAMALTGFSFNVAVIGAKAWRKIKRHAQLLGTLGANAPKILSQEQVAGILGLDEIILPRSVYNSADEGQTDSIAFMVDQTGVLFLYRAPVANTMGTSATAGAVWGWNGLLPGQTNEDGTVIGNQRIPLAFSDQVTGRAAWGQSVVSPDLGVWLGGAVA